jgi:hypothetical protein
MPETPTKDDDDHEEQVWSGPVPVTPIPESGVGNMRKPLRIWHMSMYVLERNHGSTAPLIVEYVHWTFNCSKASRK